MPASLDLWLLAAFAALAAVDGIGFHLWKLGLHARPEARREHRLHTARALLFVPILALVYGLPTGGLALWLGLSIALADTALEAWDVFEEPASRRALGGLSRAEAVLHALLVTLRAASLALAFAARPAGAWGWSAAWQLAPPDPARARFVLYGLLPGAVAVAALHLALARRPRAAVCCEPA
jgi:hypothetical protein